MDHASNYISASPKLVSKIFGCSLAHSNKLLTHTHTHTIYTKVKWNQSSLYVQWLPMGQIWVAVIYVYSRSDGCFKGSVQIYGALLLFLLGVGNLIIYHSVPEALKPHLRFWPTWVLTREQNSIHLYRSCYSGPLKCGTWTWALTRDTTVLI